MLFKCVGLALEFKFKQAGDGGKTMLPVIVTNVDNPSVCHSIHQELVYLMLLLTAAIWVDPRSKKLRNKGT